MAAGDVSVLRIVGRFQDQNIVNTLHYIHDAQVAEEDEVLNQLTLGWENAFIDPWLGRHSIAYELIGVKAFRVTGDAKIPSFRPIGEVGTVAGTAMVSFACRVLTFYTASPNFRRRGRLMLSGAVTTMFDVTDGSVILAEIEDMDTFGDEIRAPIEQQGDDFSLVIPATETLPVEPITGSRARVTPASVRSRRVRNFFIG